jgi:ferrous iron transport protein A
MKRRNMNLLARLPQILRGRQRHAPTIADATSVSATSHLHSDTHVRMPRLTLADLRKGDSGTIKTIAGSATSRLHLMEMGLTPGTSVRVVRLAVFGGPLDIVVRGYRLSLRRDEARAIQLQHSKS